MLLWWCVLMSLMPGSWLSEVLTWNSRLDDHSIALFRVRGRFSLCNGMQHIDWKSIQTKLTRRCGAGEERWRNTGEESDVQTSWAGKNTGNRAVLTKQMQGRCGGKAGWGRTQEYNRRRKYRKHSKKEMTGQLAGNQLAFLHICFPRLIVNGFLNVFFLLYLKSGL